MLRRSSPVQLPGVLPVLPLPAGAVLLPGNVLTLHIHRKDNINLLAAVVDRAEKTRGPYLAAAPLRIKQPASNDAATPTPSDAPLQVIKVPSDASNDSDSPAEAQSRPATDDINEYACAARILRVEKLSNTVVTNGVQEVTQGYVVAIEGICRVRIDRFTLVGTPYFEAQVTAFPKKQPPEAIDEDLAGAFLESANQVLDALTSSSTSPSSSRNPSLPSAPTLPTLAVKRLRSTLRNFSPTTADDVADVLLGSLLASGRPLSYSAKVHHLSLLTAKDRVEHALAQMQVLKAELESREAVGQRYVSNVQRRTRELVLRGLMEAIRQELALLRKQDDDEPDSPGMTIRVIRPNGPRSPSLRSPTTPSPEDEEEDELAALEKRLSEAKMPDDARALANRELKRLKSIPPQSIEHGGIRNYLDWLVDLPWGISSYDSPDAPKIDADFLARAKAQLDNDHFGIDKVKERLLQYLAVVRLRNEAFEIQDRAQREKEEEEEALRKKNEQGTKAIEAPPSTPVNGPAETGPVAIKVNEKVEKPKPAKKAQPQRKDKGPILLLVGPPGVGKTSIARSLASALGRPYHRISLGGVRDEAEIRGFRRTYVGSQPGVFVQALRKVKVNNPVFLLDEIDKLTSGAGFHGDPSAAMLEVLDPEQNFSFSDHYINTPVDLSSVLFIATANNLSSIPPPLLDRMEVIHLSGYVDVEKLQIARRYLLPKQIKVNQLQPSHVQIEDEVLLDVINKYCSGESGVRTLERQVGSIVRWKAVEFARARDALPSAQRPALDALEVPGYDPTVRKEDLEQILGNEYYEFEKVEDEDDVRPGVATGLAYTGSGNGDMLKIEVTSFPGKGQLKLTGSLGDVISESGQLALSWVRANAYELGLREDRKQDIMRELDLHLHMPSGAIKKDGPSAGVAMALAMVSLFSGHALDPRLAMTGEITLRGKVTPVGGVKEKVLAAHRAGVRKVILPIRNRKDILADLPARVRDDMAIEYVDNIWSALEIAFGDRLWLPAPEPVPRGAGKGVRRSQRGVQVPSRL